MANPQFWDQPDQAQKKAAQLNRLKQTLERARVLQSRGEDLQVLEQLLAEEGYLDPEHPQVRQAREEVQALEKDLDQLEVASFLSGPHDTCAAILTLHAGAGGTESCDWAEMLLRMYIRWAERQGFEAQIQDMQAGEGAGISAATIRIEGAYAYGYTKAERGVHRLVRISPFDANKRRHTSFCAVDVIAEIEDDVTVQIRDEDLRVDTYRSSGKGGQHVNKTDSAVRLTHLPTGLVVCCQSERSQLKNKLSAMKSLKARIYEKLQDEKRSQMDQFYGEKGEMGWGHQIRSYVFQPYQMVKDLRTQTETSDVQGVMDGQIDRFIHAWLRAGCPRGRMQSF